MLCPFRKMTIFMDNDGNEDFAVKKEDAYFTVEHFMDCYEEQCEMWNRVHNNCGLKYKG